MLKKLIIIGFLLALPALMVSNVAFAESDNEKQYGIKGIPIDPLLHPGNLPTLRGDNDAGGDETTRRIGGAIDYSVEATRALLLNKIINVLLGLAGTVAVFSIINNSWWLIASAGQEEKISQHKKGLMWAIIGLILIILSFSIVRFIISIPFGADQGPAPQQTENSQYRGPPAGGMPLTQ